MDDLIAFFGCDIPLFILCAYELEPVINIAIRIQLDELTPFTDIVCAHGFVARFFGDHRIGKM